MKGVFQNTGLRWLWLTLLFLAFDQGTKLWVAAHFYLGETLELIPFFNFRYAHNPGAAFSFLGNADGWQRWFFTGVAIAISAMLLWWLYKAPKQQRLLPIAYSLILSGALGNLIDRLAYGYVIDFLDVYVGSYHWPTFNIADSAIFVGAGFIIFDAFFTQEQSKSAA